MTDTQETKDLQAPHVGWTKYVVVAIVLAVITGAEIFLALSHALPGELTTALLIAFTLSKAALVMLFYMHLKYDTRWYSLALVFPLFMLVVLFGVVLIAAANWNVT
ncbi:MAG TPA: cytochrome C oxidase subunit IV family protein [Anaerolineae bacterium]|nr:cytochrome C oxidase subunit IV family protein [Anaerolineae bacterium]